MPEGYTTLVLKSDTRDQVSERSELRSRVVQKVPELTVWNYDVSADTAKNNPIARALQWTRLANILHTEDDST
jgi:hypothetical protein